jgi:hypothetical protein
MKISSIFSKVSSLFSRFEKAKKEISQPVAQPQAEQVAQRIRNRNRAYAAPAPVAPVQQPVQASAKPNKSKKITFKIPSLKAAVKLDLSKIRGVFSGLAESSIRSASKREIEGFYSTKNYKAVLLSISSDRSEENFLAVKRELKAQDILISRFSGKIMKSGDLMQRKSNVESEINKLEMELSSKQGSRRHAGSDLRSKISSLDSQVAVFKDIKKLV